MLEGVILLREPRDVPREDVDGSESGTDLSESHGTRRGLQCWVGIGVSAILRGQRASLTMYEARRFGLHLRHIDASPDILLPEALPVEVAGAEEELVSVLM